MKKVQKLATSRLGVFVGGAVLALGLIWPSISTAQNKKAKDPDSHAQHKDKQPAGDQDLASQIAELGAKVARLEAALEKSGSGMSPGMRDKKPAKGMMEDDTDEMGSMQPDQGAPAMGGMGGGASPPSVEMRMMEKMMGMMEKMMGGMSGGAMQPGKGTPAAGGMGMMEDDMDEMSPMQSSQGAPGGGASGSSVESGMMKKMDKMMGMMEKMMGGGAMQPGKGPRGTGGMGGGAPRSSVESRMMKKMDKMMGMMEKMMGGGAMQPGQGMPAAGGMQDR